MDNDYYYIVTNTKLLQRFSQSFMNYNETYAVELQYEERILNKPKFITIDRQFVHLDNILPRMLRWECKKGAYLDLNGSFIDNNQLRVVIYKNPINSKAIGTTLSTAVKNYNSLYDTEFQTIDLHKIPLKEYMFKEIEYSCYQLLYDNKETERDLMGQPAFISNLIKIPGLSYTTEDSLMFLSPYTKECNEWYADYVNNNYSVLFDIKVNSLKNIMFSTPIYLPGTIGTTIFVEKNETT